MLRRKCRARSPTLHSRLDMTPVPFLPFRNKRRQTRPSLQTLDHELFYFASLQLELTIKYSSSNGDIITPKFSLISQKYTFSYAYFLTDSRSCQFYFSNALHTSCALILVYCQQLCLVISHLLDDLNVTLNTLPHCVHLSDKRLRLLMFTPFFIFFSYSFLFFLKQKK